MRKTYNLLNPERAKKLLDTFLSSDQALEIVNACRYQKSELWALKYAYPEYRYNEIKKAKLGYAKEWMIRNINDSPVRYQQSTKFIACLITKLMPLWDIWNELENQSINVVPELAKEYLLLLSWAFNYHER